MLEIAIALIVGFALGYGVREWVPADDAKRRDTDEVFRAHVEFCISLQKTDFASPHQRWRHAAHDWRSV
jgi:hypothetical protein